MSKVIFNTATSFNGYIADDRNSLGWLFAVDEEGQPDNGAFMEGIGVLVEGSTTYEWLLLETNMLAEPQKWQGFYGDRPTFVFTSRDLPKPEGADIRFVSGAVDVALPQILEAAGDRNVWVVGGGELAGQFFDVGALDAIVLAIAPVALPGGAALLPRRIEAHSLTLENVERFGQFAQLTYRVGRSA
jgi:dihydrofolate reductase